jgi:hypothetical protein
MEYEVINKTHNNHCGCPEESLLMSNGLIILIHLEPDGSGEMFVDAGDWDDEIHICDVGSLDNLRYKACLYAASQSKECGNRIAPTPNLNRLGFITRGEIYDSSCS